MAAQSLFATLPALNQNEGCEILLGSPNNPNTLEYGSVTSVAPITGRSADNFTINVRLFRGGSLIATIGTVTFDVGVNAASRVPVELTLTSSSIHQYDDVIDVEIVQNGAGMEVPAGLVVSLGI